MSSRCRWAIILSFHPSPPPPPPQDHLSEQRKASEATLGQQEAQRLAVVSRLEEVGRREATIDTRMATLQQSVGQSEALLLLAREGSTTLKPSDKLQR